MSHSLLNRTQYCTRCRDQVGCGLCCVEPIATLVVGRRIAEVEMVSPVAFDCNEAAYRLIDAVTYMKSSTSGRRLQAQNDIIARFCKSVHIVELKDCLSLLKDSLSLLFATKPIKGCRYRRHGTNVESSQRPPRHRVPYQPSPWPH